MILHGVLHLGVTEQYLRRPQVVRLRVREAAVVAEIRFDFSGGAYFVGQRPQDVLGRWRVALSELDVDRNDLARWPCGGDRP